MNEQEETKIITRKKAMEKGLKRYFTGKPCKHGHVAERYTVSRHCSICNYASGREYYNSERGKATQRKYKISERGKAKRREYDNSERGKAIHRKYKISERGKAKRREYDNSESGTKEYLKKRLGTDPPEELIKAVHTNRQIKRFIKQQKQNQ
jgi:hypothetical protein